MANLMNPLVVQLDEFLLIWVRFGWCKSREGGREAKCLFLRPKKYKRNWTRVGSTACTKYIIIAIQSSQMITLKWKRGFVQQFSVKVGPTPEFDWLAVEFQLRSRFGSDWLDGGSISESNRQRLLARETHSGGTVSIKLISLRLLPSSGSWYWRKLRAFYQLNSNCDDLVTGRVEGMATAPAELLAARLSISWAQ